MILAIHTEVLQLNLSKVKSWQLLNPSAVNMDGKGGHSAVQLAIFNPYIVEQWMISYSSACVMAISNRMRHCTMQLHRQYCKKSLIAQQCKDKKLPAAAHHVAEAVVLYKHCKK